MTLNAANEVAVEAFLDGRIRFDRIAALVEAVLDTSERLPVDSLQHVLQQDELARVKARELMRKLS